MDNFNYAGFNKKYGLNISPDPTPSNGDTAMEEASDEMYYASREKPHWAIPRLEKLIDRYPEEHQFLNYLYAAYVTSGQLEQARRTLERTMRLHPNYLFGAVNYVLYENDEQWTLTQGSKLGKHLSLTDWPARADGTYHHTELLGFERAAIIYLTAQGKLREAKERINRLLEFGADEEDLKVCIERYQRKTMEMAGTRQQNRKKMSRHVEHAVTTGVTSADADQPLTHPEVDDLRNYDPEDMTEQKLAALLALPRESLIEDLRKVLRSGIGYYLRKYEHDDWEEKFDEGDDPVFHALYLIGALEATEALPEVLDFLRIDEDAALDFFGDYGTVYYQPTLFSLTKDRPSALVDYLQEPRNYSFDRITAVEVLVQIALHFPDRRAEVIDGLGQIWQRTLDQPDDRLFVDTILTAYVLEGARVLRATELLPLARELAQHNLIDPTITGAVEDVEHEFHRPFDAGDRQPQPTIPYEYYSEAYLERKAPADFPVETEGFNTPLDMILVDRIQRMLQARESSAAAPKQVAHVQKVGRNDPCPCGSGKKYKKCCLGK